MVTIKPGETVYIVAKSKHRKGTDFSGRFGRVLRVDETKAADEPAVCVGLDDTIIDSRVREWCWRDEIQVL